MDLPYITNEPGIGGKLRQKPEHFRVEEIPVYLPTGEGSHLYINITKTLLSTKEALEKISLALQIPAYEIGVAGLKDKYAVTTQTISINLEGKKLTNEEISEKIQKTGIKINWMKLHTNKLKPGHLLGNKFEIIISEAKDIKTAEKTASILRKTGIPNFYGEQRFGVEKNNAEKGLAILKGELNVQDRWLKRLLLSSYQSYLFNLYLSERIKLGNFDKLILGDICKKSDTGGLFSVENLENEQKRFDVGEISFTGPMFGKKLWFAESESGEFEKQILKESGLSEEEINRLGEGLRRAGRIFLKDLSIEKTEEGIKICFALPKGSFATIVLREFMK
jgi:tRNA pseudouridine13 synthase